MVPSPAAVALLVSVTARSAAVTVRGGPFPGAIELAFIGGLGGLGAAITLFRGACRSRYRVGGIERSHVWNHRRHGGDLGTSGVAVTKLPQRRGRRGTTDRGTSVTKSLS